MAARLETLRHHGVRTSGLGCERLGKGRDAGEPGDPMRLQYRHLIGRKQPHDR